MEKERDVVNDSGSSSGLPSLDTIIPRSTINEIEKEIPDVVNVSDSSSDLPSLDTIIPRCTFDEAEKERPVNDSDSSSGLPSLDTIIPSTNNEKERPVVINDSDSSSGLPSLDTIIPSTNNEIEKEIPDVVNVSDSSSDLPSLDTIVPRSTFDETEKETPDVNDSDSSSGLPSLESLFPRYTFDVTKLKRDDIVWAKYKKLYWPSLVRNVDKKKKKVTVWYLDSPGKSFKVPFKKIRCYEHLDTSISIEKIAKTTPFAKLHSRVCSRAHLFIENVGRGIEVNPIEFFDLSKPFFMVAKYYPGCSSSNTENTSTPGSSESKLRCENTSLPESSAFNNESALTEKSDENVDREESSEDENSTKSDVQDHTSAYRFPLIPEAPCPYDDEMINKIISCITEGHVDNYLLDIYTFKVENDVHRAYMKAVETNTTESMFLNPKRGVPINTAKLQPVTVHLYDLFKKNFEEKGGWTRQYIVLVWLPEAVEKAVSLIKAESFKLFDLSCSSMSVFDSLNGTYDFFVDSDSSIISIPSPFRIGVFYSSSDSFTDSSSTNSFSAPKRKLDFASCFTENNDSYALDAEASTSKKKK